VPFEVLFGLLFAAGSSFGLFDDGGELGSFVAGFLSSSSFCASGPAPTNASQAAKQNVAMSMGARMCAVLMRSFVVRSVIRSPPCVDSERTCVRVARSETSQEQPSYQRRSALIHAEIRRAALAMRLAVGADLQDRCRCQRPPL
jgi:hypothetical protein